MNKSRIRRKPMKSLMILLALITALASTALPSYALTGKEIIRKTEDAMRGTSVVGTYLITVKTKLWTRTMKLKAYDQRAGKKSFNEIYEPKKDAGNRFLMINKNMWHYVPKLQQTIKISPSMMLQSWMGSDFTNDDIVKESSIEEDYTHAVTGAATVDGHPCHVITLTPKPDAAVVWGKIIYSVRQSDYLPVREEFYNEHNVLKRVMTFGQFKKMDDRVIPTLWKMQTVSKPEAHTILEIASIRFNTAIPSRTFTMQNLTRK